MFSMGEVVESRERLLERTIFSGVTEGAKKKFKEKGLGLMIVNETLLWGHLTPKGLVGKASWYLRSRTREEYEEDLQETFAGIDRLRAEGYVVEYNGPTSGERYFGDPELSFMRNHLNLVHSS